MRLSAIVSAIVLAAALTGCTVPTTPTAVEAAPALELRTWQLGTGQVKEVADALNDVFYSSEWQAHASAGPNGRLMVVGNSQMLDGVADYLETVTENAGPQSAGKNVSLQYWVVRAEPAEAVSMGPGLTRVSETLSAISEADGPQAYSLMAAQTVHTRDGERGSFQEHEFAGQHRVSIQSDEVVAADVKLRVPGSFETETRMVIHTDQTTALSQSVAIDDEQLTTVYTLVRASIQ